MNKKTNSSFNPFRILETAWLVICILGFIGFIVVFILGRRDQAPYIALYTIIAGLMFLVRRKMRMKFEKPTVNGPAKS